MIKKLDEEILFEKGLLNEANTLISKRYARSQIKRRERLKLASLARRLNNPLLGLKILQPIIRSEKLLFQWKKESI